MIVTHQRKGHHLFLYMSSVVDAERSCIFIFWLVPVQKELANHGIIARRRRKGHHIIIWSSSQKGTRERGRKTESNLMWKWNVVQETHREVYVHIYCFVAHFTLFPSFVITYSHQSTSDIYTLSPLILLLPMASFSWRIRALLFRWLICRDDITYILMSFPGSHLTVSWTIPLNPTTTTFLRRTFPTFPTLGLTGSDFIDPFWTIYISKPLQVMIIGISCGKSIA